MEFDSLFTAVQGIMRSNQNCTIIPFVKVNQDNDIISKKIVEAINSLIVELSLKDDHKRKINLLLMINTDFPSILTLEDDQNFWHLLSVFPKMSPYLYFQVVTNLNFHSFIGEVLYSCPEYISIEVFESLTDHFKSLNPDIIIPLLHSVYEAAFWKIIHLQKEKKPSIISKKFVQAFRNAIGFDFQELLENAEWEKEKKLVYFGYVAQMLLMVLRSSISKMRTGQNLNHFAVYDFNVDFDYSKWEECTTVIDWVIHSLALMLAKCAGAVMSISVDMYMIWCEEDIKGSVDKTLQTAVREAAYYCREEIRSIMHLENDISGLKTLESSLNHIALQPITEDDEITKADAETIIMNLLNPKKTQVKWLKGLIRIPGIFQSSTYMQVIQDNAHLFDLDVAKVLLDALIDFLSNSQCPRDFYEVAKDLFFSCLSKQSLELQVSLLSYYFDQNCYANMLQKENFEETMISTLNKLSATNENKNEMLAEIVRLGFENREDLVRSLLKECLSSAMKADILLDLLSQIPALASVPCSNSHLGITIGTTVHLMDTVITSLDKNKDNFIQLVKKLCALGFLDANVFFPDHVMPRFEECIKENDVQQINFFLDLLTVYIGQPSLPTNSTAFLVFCAKLLDSIRPGIANFSVEGMSATAKTVDVVRQLSKNIVNAKKQPDEEIRWLREMASKLKGGTRLHLQVFWSHWGEVAPSIPAWASSGLGLGVELLSATPVLRREIVMSTVKVLPTITLCEWYMLGALDSSDQSLLVPTVEVLVDSILVSVQVPFLLKNLKIINNILINFCQFLWEKVVPKLKKRNEKEVERLQERVSHLQEVIPKSLQKSRVPQIQLLIQAITRISH